MAVVSSAVWAAKDPELQSKLWDGPGILFLRMKRGGVNTQ